MGEFGASLFIARPDTPTIPVAIFRLLGQPGALNYGQALAMSSILMLVSAAGFIVIERLRSTGIGEF
jgi:thiamine transport system permease protein